MDYLLGMASENIFSVVSLLLAVLGMVLAYIFYRRSLRDKEPSWDSRTVNLVQGITTKLEGLTLLFSGQKVANISVTKLLFWNNGHTTIDKSDVPSTDPIRITAAETVRILHASIIAENNNPSEFRIADDVSEEFVELSFEYLDKDQGAVIQLVHDGLDSSSVNLEGTIKGARSLQKRSIKQYQPNRISPALRRALVRTVGIIGLSFVGLIDLYLIFVPRNPTSTTPTWLTVLLFTLFLGAYFLILLSDWQYICPRGLEVFLDQIPTKKDGS